MKKQRGLLGLSSRGLVLAGCLWTMTGCVPWDGPERQVKHETVASAAAAGAEARYLSLYDQDPAITVFPVEIYGMSSLTKLSLRGNPCPLPEGISALGALSWLDLGEMGLTQLPSDLSQLPALRSIYLTDNRISALPKDFGRLGALEYVNLDRNQLKALPKDLSGLKALKWLRLNSNALRSLPPSIGSLPLERLYLRNNQLSSLPPEIAGLKGTLLELFLEGNPLTQESRDAIAILLPGVKVYF